MRRWYWYLYCMSGRCFRVRGLLLLLWQSARLLLLGVYTSRSRSVWYVYLARFFRISWWCTGNGQRIRYYRGRALAHHHFLGLPFRLACYAIGGAQSGCGRCAICVGAGPVQ